MDGRTIWVRDGDVEGRIGEGAMVTAARDLSDWCLRGDDGSEPVAAGTVLEIVETRPYGAAMAMETDCPRRRGACTGTDRSRTYGTR